MAKSRETRKRAALKHDLEIRLSKQKPAPKPKKKAAKKK